MNKKRFRRELIDSIDALTAEIQDLKIVIRDATSADDVDLSELSGTVDRAQGMAESLEESGIVEEEDGYDESSTDSR